MPGFIRSFNAKAESFLKAFFKPPFSISAGMILGFIFGLISPVLLPLLEKRTWPSVPETPWKFLLAVMIPVALIHWWSATARFQWSRLVLVGNVLATFLFCLSAAISYYGCYRDHVCMGGHLEHPPYPAITYFSDAGWAIGLIVSAVMLARSKSPFRIAAVTTAGFLISMRFVFGSFGGRYPFF